MEIRAILEKLGYKDLLPDEWYTRISGWNKWYGGKTAFHEYTVYNGNDNIKVIRKSLGMAKKVSEDKADLLLNEKVTMSVSPRVPDGQQPNTTKTDTGLQDYVDGVLDANDFWVAGNELIELTNALGTGAFVEYLENGETKIDYVNAQHIYPLSWNRRKIRECAFISRFSAGKDGEQIYINRHVIENGLYTVYNDLFDKEGKQIALTKGVQPVWKTGSKRPLFQIIKPNICNNIHLSNPMGISIFANSIDDLETVDLIYDSHHNEFRLGKKRIFIDDSMVKPNPKSGELMPIFDPNDTVFYGIPGGGGDDKKPITESNMDLRIDAHIKGLQTALDILSEKTGFGKGYYKFDVDNVQTATAVISQNSKLYRRIKKDEIILDSALTDMVRAILFLGGKDSEADISINFDDSIIEDTDAIANRAMREKTTGIIDDIIYFQRVYKMTEEAATELVKKIEDRAPAPPLNPFTGA